MAGQRRIAIVGSGVTGLAAALRLRDRLGPAAEITVVDQARAPGGKLHTGELAGLVAEQGAEAFLLRQPGGTGESAVVSLVHRLGLTDDLVHPAPVPPGLLIDGRLRSLPAGTFLGIPADPRQVAGIASVPPGRDRDLGRPVLPAGTDVAVGELVRQRLGDEVVDRLVDPLLGGVYAGRADRLSLAATMPGLAAACATETTLAAAVRAAQAAAPRPTGGPVFGSLRGGLGQLVTALSDAVGARWLLGEPVRRLTPDRAGWRLTIGSTRDPYELTCDAVVLAVPAAPATRLLADLGVSVDLDYASVALVTLALPPVELPAWSGFLVPAGEPLTLKAATFLTNKWPHLRRPEQPVLVRASVGRYGDPGPLRLTDAALVARVHAELSEVLRPELGRDLPPPRASRVQRWGGALPQYPPGHVDRVARLRAALPDTLRLAGAAYDGVGIPVCVRSGETAADELAASLGA